MQQGTYSVTATDVTRQHDVSASGVPGNATIGELVAELLTEMHLPQNDAFGQEISYRARLERDGRQLLESEHVSEAIEQDDQIVLQPEIHAGSSV